MSHNALIYKHVNLLNLLIIKYINKIDIIIKPKLTISNKIKSIKNNYYQFLKFLEYFYKTYLVSYDMKIWNYYNNNNMEHIKKCLRIIQ